MPTRLDRLGIVRRVRQRLGPEIDSAARLVMHPEDQVRQSAYVGTVHVPIEELEAELQEGGFTWDPLSFYHYTPEGSSTDGSWVYRRRLFGDRQLHVVLFAQRSDRIDVYAHDEYNWLRHPIRHVRQVDIRLEEGAREMRRWLDSRDLSCRHEGLWRRKLAHVAERIRERRNPLDWAAPS